MRLSLDALFAAFLVFTSEVVRAQYLSAGWKPGQPAPRYIPPSGERIAVPADFFRANAVPPTVQENGDGVLQKPKGLQQRAMRWVMANIHRMNASDIAQAEALKEAEENPVFHPALEILSDDPGRGTMVERLLDFDGPAERWDDVEKEERRWLVLVSAPQDKKSMSIDQLLNDTLSLIRPVDLTEVEEADGVSEQPLFDDEEEPLGGSSSDDGRDPATSALKRKRGKSLKGWRFGRVNYFDESRLTTMWGVWRVPMFIFITPPTTPTASFTFTPDHLFSSSSEGPTPVKQKPYNMRFFHGWSFSKQTPEKMRNFLADESNWQWKNVWESEWAPGGKRARIMDHIADFMALYARVMDKVPPIVFMILTGAVSSQIISFMHRGDDAMKAKEKEKRQARLGEERREVLERRREEVRKSLKPTVIVDDKKSGGDGAAKQRKAKR